MEERRGIEIMQIVEGHRDSGGAEGHRDSRGAEGHRYCRGREGA